MMRNLEYGRQSEALRDTRLTSWTDCALLQINIMGCWLRFGYWNAKNIQAINDLRYVTQDGIRTGSIVKIAVLCVILVWVPLGYICNWNGLETMVDCTPGLGAFSLNRFTLGVTGGASAFHQEISFVYQVDG